MTKVIANNTKDNKFPGNQRKCQIRRKMHSKLNIITPNNKI